MYVFLVPLVPLDRTALTGCLDWRAPTSRCIQYRILVYSPTGECLQSYSAYDDQLGVRTLRISALGMIAAGSYDEKVRSRAAAQLAGHVPPPPRNSPPHYSPHARRGPCVRVDRRGQVRVLDPLTWKLCCELAHASTLTVKDSAVVRVPSVRALAG